MTTAEHPTTPFLSTSRQNRICFNEKTSWVCQKTPGTAAVIHPKWTKHKNGDSGNG